MYFKELTECEHVDHPGRRISYFCLTEELGQGANVENEAGNKIQGKTWRSL